MPPDQSEQANPPGKARTAAGATNQIDTDVTLLTAVAAAGGVYIGEADGLVLADVSAGGTGSTKPPASGGDDDGGCGCSVPRSSNHASLALVTLGALAAFARRRRQS